MARATNVPSTKKTHKKYLKAAKGFVGGRRKCYRIARETVERAWKFATIHRRLKKRDFRTLWIARISAAVSENGLSYSRFISGLTKSNVQLDRKSLSEIAQYDPNAFKKIIEVAKSN